MHRRGVRGLLVAVLSLPVALPVAARAGEAGCQRAIIGASGAYTRAIVRGRTAGVRAPIVRACAGPPAGWGPTCPAFATGACTGPVASAEDVAACVACIDGAAVDAVRTLVGGDASASGCRAALRRAVARFIVSRSKALGRCWTARVRGAHANACPEPGDGRAAPAIATAEATLRGRIERACRGVDPAAIGLPALCPEPCARPLAGPADVAACAACVTGFAVDCADRAAVPGLASYPAACRPPGAVCAAGVECSTTAECPPGYTCRDNGVATTRYCVGDPCAGDGDCGGGGVCRQHCTRQGFAVVCGTRRCQCPGFGCTGPDELCVESGTLACRKLCLQDSDCIAPFGAVCVNQGTFSFGTCIGTTPCE